MVRENRLVPSALVLPLFVQEGETSETPISSLPGHARLGIDRLVRKAEECLAAGLRAVALFPALAESLKDPAGRESANPEGLLPRAVRALKRRFPELVVITDVALDPYSSDGHDGLVVDGRIDNDLSLPLLSRMALV